MRFLEIGLCVAVLLRAVEHTDKDRALFAMQGLAALVLLFGILRAQMVCGLWILSLWQLYRFQGPYNGGADKTALLCVTCLLAAHAAPTPFWQELALAYLAVQIILSYFVSGWVKLRNPDWRSGQALSDVFAFSAYPVAENLRFIAHHRSLTRAASWLVIVLEVAFPLSFLVETTLLTALVLAGAFHLLNALLFGLNRFLWIWLASYPVLLWFQDRMIL